MASTSPQEQVQTFIHLLEGRRIPVDPFLARLVFARFANLYVEEIRDFYERVRPKSVRRLRGRADGESDLTPFELFEHLYYVNMFHEAKSTVIALRPGELPGMADILIAGFDRTGLGKDLFSCFKETGLTATDSFGYSDDPISRYVWNIDVTNVTMSLDELALSFKEILGVEHKVRIIAEPTLSPNRPQREKELFEIWDSRSRISNKTKLKRHFLSRGPALTIHPAAELSVSPESDVSYLERLRNHDDKRIVVPMPGREVPPPTPLPESEDDLGKLLELERRMRLALDPFRAAMSDVLKNMGGKNYGSYEANKAVVDAVNRMGRILDIRVCDPASGEPATLSCYNPPRTIQGIFRLRRQVEGKQACVYSDPKLPSDLTRPTHLPHKVMEPEAE